MMDMLTRTAIGENADQQSVQNLTNVPVQKPSRSFLLHAVSSYLLKAYRETPNNDDKIPAEEIHFNVNRSDTIPENISFITASRLVKSTFKNCRYDKDTKFFHCLERIYPEESLCTVKDRNIMGNQPRWSSTLLSTLAQLYENQMVCDAVIVCRDKPASIEEFLHAHTCVLASASPLLLNKLMKRHILIGVDGSVSSKVAIRCDGISSSEWSMILNFIYNGQIELSLKNAIRMWTLARFLRIQSLVMLLENLMKENHVLLGTKLRSQSVDQGELIVTSLQSNYLSNKRYNDDTPIDFSKSSEQIFAEPFHFDKSNESNDMEYSMQNIAERVMEGILHNNFDGNISDSEHFNITPQTDDNEPKSKRRKMYVPRKVPAKLAAEVNVIGTIQTTTHRTKSEKNSSDTNENCGENQGKKDNDESRNNEYEYENQGEHSEMTSVIVKKEPLGDEEGVNDSNDSPDNWYDHNTYECPARPLVIQPLEDAVSPKSISEGQVKKEIDAAQSDQDRGEEGSNSADGSMLFGLLNTPKDDTPMLKSLLASKAKVTDSPSHGLASQMRKAERATDSENEMQDIQRTAENDPDYTVTNEKSKRKRRRKPPTGGQHISTQPTQANRLSPPPHLQKTFTWSAEDLAKEREKLGVSEGGFSASTLLLSMIDKATPRHANDTSKTAPKNDGISKTLLKMSVKHDGVNEEKSKSENDTVKHSDKQFNDQSLHTSNTQASNILVNLLAKTNVGKAELIAKRSNESSESTHAEASLSMESSGNSQSSLLFSHVLQGMASAYTSPIGKRSSSPQAANSAASRMSTAKAGTLSALLNNHSAIANPAKDSTSGEIKFKEEPGIARENSEKKSGAHKNKSKDSKSSKISSKGQKQKLKTKLGEFIKAKKKVTKSSDDQKVQYENNTERFSSERKTESVNPDSLLASHLMCSVASKATASLTTKKQSEDETFKNDAGINSRSALASLLLSNSSKSSKENKKGKEKIVSSFVKDKSSTFTHLHSLLDPEVRIDFNASQLQNTGGKYVNDVQSPEEDTREIDMNRTGSEDPGREQRWNEYLTSIMKNTSMS